MTPRQRKFCDEYLISGNATDAAIKAGYSPKTAKQTGSENLAKPDLKAYIESPARDTEDYYRQVIAEKFAFEKRLIVSTLKQHGIYSLLTTPENLSIDVINKYLEMKSRQLL